MAVAGTLSLTLAGCGAIKNAAHSPSVPGATVVVAEAPQTPPSWFFPVINATDFTELNVQMEFLMYRPLIYLTKNNRVDYARSLASHITVNPQGSTYVITLGNRYRWSNGRPVTAQDVVFTVNLMKAASQPNAPWVFGGLGSGGMPDDWQSVTAQGAHTVVVHLAHPANPVWFIHNGLSQVFPVPQSVWDKYPENMNKELQMILAAGNTPTNPLYHVIDGPFKFLKWQPNEYWAFVPNPHFGGHKASIAHLIFQYEASSSAQFVGLRNGTISVGYLPPSMWNARKDLTHDVLSSSYLFAMNYIAPNLNPKAPGSIGAAFSHLYVRQALEMGIDQKGIIQALYHGEGVATDGPIPPKPATAFYDPSLETPVYPFDPSRGKALLKEHGWRLVNGVMSKGGQSLKLTMLYASGSVTETDLMQVLKSDWAREGIQVSLQSMPLNQVFGEVSQSDPTRWQMGYWGTGLAYQYNYYPTGGSMFATGGAYNDSGYTNLKANQLIHETYLPGTTAQIQERMDAYQEFVAHQLPVLWMPWFPSGYARVIGLNVHARTVHGTVKYFNPVTDYLYANYWTVSS